MNPCARRLSRAEVSVRWLAKCAKCTSVCSALLFAPYYSEPNQASPCTECISGCKLNVMKMHQNCLRGGFEALFLIITRSLLPHRAENTWKYIIVAFFSIVRSFTPLTVDGKQLCPHLQNPYVFNPPTCRTCGVLIDDIMLPSNGSDGFRFTAAMFLSLHVGLFIDLYLGCLVWVTSFRKGRCRTSFAIDNKSPEIKLTF